MMDPDHPEVVRSLAEASPRVEAFCAELLAAYPALRDSLAIPGMLIGHGLGAFVARGGLTDAEIVVQVLAITKQIRQALAALHVAASSN